MMANPKRKTGHPWADTKTQNQSKGFGFEKAAFAAGLLKYARQAGAFGAVGRINGSRGRGEFGKEARRGLLRTLHLRPGVGQFCFSRQSVVDSTL
jgi:hypothetical protein